MIELFESGKLELELKDLILLLGKRKESGRNVVSPDLTLTEATENLLGQLQGKANTSKAKREICQKSKGRRLRLQN